MRRLLIVQVENHDDWGILLGGMAGDNVDMSAEKYISDLSAASQATGLPVLAYPVGPELYVVKMLEKKGLAVRRLTLDEFKQVRNDQHVAVAGVDQ